MSSELETADVAEDLMQYLASRIEEIERVLQEDEDFCNKDINDTYQAAIKYVKTVGMKFQEKLNELKQKLDRITEENLKMSKKNKKKLDEESDLIDQLFLSGKYEEAKEKLHEYERCLQQRATIYQTIPVLYMNDIDINQYLSFDKSVLSSVPSAQQSTEDAKRSKQEDGHSDGQQMPAGTKLINRNDKSPATTVSTRPLRLSTRLPPSPSSKNLSTSDSETITPRSVQNNSMNLQENMLSCIPSRSLSSTSTLNQQSKSIAAPTRNDGLNPRFVASYKHDRNIILMMVCNKDYIILFKRQSERLPRWHLNVIVRRNRISQDLDWDVHSITSIGLLDEKHLYMFAGHQLLIYSLDSFLITNSYLLSHTTDNCVQNDAVTHGIGTVFNGYIYYISYNEKSRWILSILELETMSNLFDYDLTEAFPDVKCFIHICVNDTTVGFLVKLDSCQYAVIFCSSHSQLTMQCRRLIYLSYAENPLSICSVYIRCLHKHIFFVNDASAKIIHLVTTEKYIQSYTITVHSLHHAKESDEIFLALDDGIYTIRLKDHENFFSKFH
ncbi:unnamed protein product [Adineta ricciae]|uniref:Uncharacterized protein n=1 Tax=Adineta ricciae TaxID=249248 RepID=A0A813VVL2_ADIRI|nr:unnamed protein product [Adineta ricciae]CAF0845678.1 unnamed protein product [Adineta ricciae]